MSTSEPQEGGREALQSSKVYLPRRCPSPLANIAARQINADSLVGGRGVCPEIDQNNSRTLAGPAWLVSMANCHDVEKED